MIWQNHILFGTSCGLFFSAPIEAFPLLILGSVVPDRIETLRRFRILPHRTLSHSILLWVLVFMAFRLGTGTMVQLIPYFFFPANAVQGFFVGVFSHLLGDALTMTGVPVLFNRPRLALKLFRTGSSTEFVVTAGTFLASLVFFSLKSGFLR